eukprot:CAMPEP_0168770106 /NCGR_PEP_ID=MMETSP0725-20121227/2743_1 /TAXON_ID=265536 /ORGANISM="Amphiprora sp., Strain CCMP467" /LENGTH=40 /DNA_ID= /DNA_START= /DNA_END= /DNA_ORIENTATION=
MVSTQSSSSSVSSISPLLEEGSSVGMGGMDFPSLPESFIN